MHAPRPAVFLDRDGTINEEVEYLSDPDQLRLIPGVVEAIKLLNREGIPVFVVTNQAGVGRGYFTIQDAEAVNQRLTRVLEAHGARLSGIDLCPHHPDDACDCRKPRAGMILRAAERHGFDLARSFMVGDKRSDLIAGRNAGCQTVLVLTGYGGAERLRCEGIGERPDWIAADLLDATRWIMEQITTDRRSGDGLQPPRDPIES